MGLTKSTTYDMLDQRYILAKRYELRAMYPGSNNSYEVPDEQKAVYYIFDLASKIYKYRSSKDIIKMT